MSSPSTGAPLSRLLAIMTRLRDPQQGCPWDQRQTFDTIAPCTLEETYEVLDAIARRDFDDLRGELGDLLFQVVFYAEMAREQGQFDFDMVCEAISDKLERRHPHLFADAQARLSSVDQDAVSTAQATVSVSDTRNVNDSANVSADQGRWEQIKRQERAALNRLSPLDDIPDAQPALMKAQKIQQRVAAVGFDWTTLGPVVDKVYEEIDEVMHEARQAVVDEGKLEEEMGDLLFATVNLSRHLGQRAEVALQKANRKFERRFRQVEALINAQGSSLEQASLEQMELAWQQVKGQEKAN